MPSGRDPLHTKVCNGSGSTYVEPNHNSDADNYTVNFQSNVRKSIDKKNVRVISISIPSHIDLINIDTFTISLCGNEIWSIPFCVVLKNKNICFSSTTQYIKIESSIFGDVNFYNMLYDSEFFLLTSKINFDYQICFSNIENPYKTYDQLNNFYYINQYKKFKIYDGKSSDISCGVSTSIYLETYSPLKSFELRLNNFLSTNYTSKIMNFFDPIIYKNVWTQDQSIALFDTLQYSLPNEMICEIEKHLICIDHYVYHVPFGVSDCDDDHSTINFSRINEAYVKITTLDDTNIGNLIVKYKNGYTPIHNMFQYSGF